MRGRAIFEPLSRIFWDTFGFWVVLDAGSLGPFPTFGIAEAHLNYALETQT